MTLWTAKTFHRSSSCHEMCRTNHANAETADFCVQQLKCVAQCVHDIYAVHSYSVILDDYLLYWHQRSDIKDVASFPRGVGLSIRKGYCLGGKLG